jgi:hypothetical protein
MCEIFGNGAMVERDMSRMPYEVTVAPRAG